MIAGLPVAAYKNKGTAYGPINEHDLQPAEHQLPVLASDLPVLCGTLRDQIQHSAQGIIIM